MKQFKCMTLLLILSCGLGCQMFNLLSALSPSPTPTARPRATATAPIAQALTLPTEPPAAPPSEAPPVTATIKENNLRVRAAPNTNAAVVDHLNKGDTVEVVGRTAASDWLQIIQPQKPDRGGWISAPYAQVNGSLDIVPITQPGQPSAPPTLPRPQPSPPPPPPPPSYPYP